MTTTFYLSRGNEPNLTAENVKDGVTIYNVLGTYQGSISGGGACTAITGVVNCNGYGHPGEGGWLALELPSGAHYEAPVSLKATDANFVASNIKSGVSIFSLEGTYEGSISGGGDALTGNYIASSVQGAGGYSLRVGIPTTGNYTHPTNIYVYDDDFTASNIKAGVDIFGVVGTFTGELPRTGQTTSYHTGDDGDLEAGSVLTGGDRWEDNGDNTITDEATGLMWVKDCSLIIPGYSGALSTNKGTWATNLGSITLRQYVDVGNTQFSDCVMYSTAVAENGFVFNAISNGNGDNKWYRCVHSGGYTVSAYQPGMETGWATKWTALGDWFEGTEGITYTTSDYRISTSNYQLYHCTTGYTTGASPDDPSVDTTHWASASTASWAEGTSYSIGNIVDVYGSYYRCTSAHTATYHRPEDDNAYWTYVEDGFQLTDSSWAPCRFVCIQAHTAASDKTPANASYWKLFDSIWYHRNPKYISGYLEVLPPATPANLTAAEWMDVIDDLNAVHYNGCSDWRMPNLLELLTTMDCETMNLFAAYSEPQFWHNSEYGKDGHGYWSSTAFKPSADSGANRMILRIDNLAAANYNGCGPVSHSAFYAPTLFCRPVRNA